MPRRWSISRSTDNGWQVHAGTDTLSSGIASRDQALAQLRERWALADDGAAALDGPAFTCPLIAAEGVETGDGRIIDTGALTWRDLPLPLMGLWETGMGHDGAVVVGRFDEISRVPGGLSGKGVFLNTDDGNTAADLARSQAVKGVSVDLDMVDAVEEETGPPDEDGWVPYRLRVTAGRAMAATQCPMPAFQECTIELAGEPVGTSAASMSNERCEPCEAQAAEMASRADVLTWTADSDGPRRRQAVTASGVTAPERPPAEWFTDPGYTDDNTVPVPGYPGKRGHALTIDDDGRVHGHAALWGVCHIGFDNECVMAPRSPSGYAHYRLGEAVCADGSRVAVGRLTVGTGHAPTDQAMSAAAVVAHYDNTGTAVADVACGEDAYGVWVSGAIRPGATTEQVEALRRSSLSGDWRAVGGQLDMVAALAVNVPGFGVPRYALAASGDRLPVQVRRRVEQGRTVALVAAGAAPLAELAAAPWTADLEQLRAENADLRTRLERLEPVVLPMVASAASARARAALEGSSR